MRAGPPCSRELVSNVVARVKADVFRMALVSAVGGWLVRYQGAIRD